MFLKYVFSYFINQTGGPYCSDLVMLTHNLLVTGRQNNLVVWDVRLPDPVKIVKIGHPDCSQNVKILSHLEDDAIVCSYGSKLRLVRFPTFSGKNDWNNQDCFKNYLHINSFKFVVDHGKEYMPKCGQSWQLK